eukprot:CAMPEP_0184694792 /NCGR_PEP_ID=MMETSP0313-20130426/2644_1 /TAXON_ID=2792 /ORGANISM="Porphyridium aerugineum, Strain SAG 1380-2" /LENGTH=340 /DNA_ID=CAMNT_0027153143 /DNA_START=1 /DNA_END=1023 /DNA_ORIENTATION=+
MASPTSTEIEKAERAFQSYDFSSDNGYKKFEQSSTILDTSAAAEEKLKRYYFRKHIDKNLPVEKQAKPSSSNDRTARSGTSSSHARTDGTQPSTSFPSYASVPGSGSIPIAYQPTGTSLGILTTLTSVPARIFFHGFVLFMAITSALSLGVGKGEFMFGKAHTAALLTYALGVWKKCGNPRVTSEYLQSTLRQDDMHYFLFCIFMKMCPVPILMSLVPPVVFAFYGFIGAVDQYLAEKNRRIAQFDKIKSLANQYRHDAQYLVVASEVMLIPNLFVWVFKNPLVLLSVLTQAQFLRLRYQVSPLTRQYITHVDGQIRQNIQKYLPQSAMTAYNWARQRLV